MLDKRIEELLEKELLEYEELEEILDSDNIVNWENNGNSGKYDGYIWYSVTVIDGEEYQIYGKSLE